MRWVNVKLQWHFMHRRGLRGRWLTVYLHKYGGSEVTERFHTHPWRLAFGVILKGVMLERFRAAPHVAERRRPGSVRFYSRRTSHRIERAEGLSIFVGLLRTQRPIERAAECPMPEGFGHYTECMPDETGWRPDTMRRG